jgi:protocatechuate 3,4-dioxygenase beta subunit
MNPYLSRRSRREFLATLTAGAAFFTTKGLFAEALTADLAATPERTEGPFYPDRLPLDVDNDLIIINDSITSTGSPVKDVTVEIWQCDANEVYLNTRDSNQKKDQQDKNFQGFGRFTTASTGEYRFRTIKPVPYPGRPAPHIHFKVKKGDRELLTSQFNIAGHPGNKRDGIAMEGSMFERELLMAEFVPIKGSKTGELAANFDIVLGRTPDDRDRLRNR